MLTTPTHSQRPFEAISCRSTRRRLSSDVVGSSYRSCTDGLSPDSLKRNPNPYYPYTYTIHPKPRTQNSDCLDHAPLYTSVVYHSVCQILQAVSSCTRDRRVDQFVLYINKFQQITVPRPPDLFLSLSRWLRGGLGCGLLLGGDSLGFGAQGLGKHRPSLRSVMLCSHCKGLDRECGQHGRKINI